MPVVGKIVRPECEAVPAPDADERCGAQNLVECRASVCSVSGQRDGKGKKPGELGNKHHIHGTQHQERAIRDGGEQAVAAEDDGTYQQIEQACQPA